MTFEHRYTTFAFILNSVDMLIRKTWKLLERCFIVLYFNLFFFLFYLQNKQKPQFWLWQIHEQNKHNENNYTDLNFAKGKTFKKYLKD